MGNASADRAYNHIRKKILSGEFPPGMPLRTHMLSDEVRVSRTPVQDALRQLEADGLVTIQPRVGASVKVMDLKELREICGLRLALESYAASLAAQERSNPDLQYIRLALESMHELTERFARDRDPAVLDEIGREDVRFHIAIIEAAKSELLKNEIMRLHLINRVLAGANRIQAGAVAVETAQADNTDIVAHRRSIQAEHEAIYEAVKQGDAPAAMSAMARHLQEIIDSNLRSRVRAGGGLARKPLSTEEMTYNMA